MQYTLWPLYNLQYVLKTWSHHIYIAKYFISLQYERFHHNAQNHEQNKGSARRKRNKTDVARRKTGKKLQSN